MSMSTERPQRRLRRAGLVLLWVILLLVAAVAANVVDLAVESDAQTGKWQELTPTLSRTCAVFPHTEGRVQAQQGDYAWALWRPYSCCEREGQVFLGSVDFF